MTKISIKVNGASVSATVEGKLTSGMVGIPVTISYDSSWDDLIKTVSFRNGDFTRSRYSVGTSTSVPWEVMRRSGNVLEVGIEGRDADGNVVMPTVWASVSKIHQGANASTPAAPNPDSGEIPSGVGAVIDDGVIASDKTWSSQKISDEISNVSGGGVSEAGYRHINTITNNTGESVPSLEINRDFEGQPFSCSDFLIFATFPSIPSTAVGQLYIGPPRWSWIAYENNAMTASATRQWRIHLWHCHDGLWCYDGVYSDNTLLMMATSGVRGNIFSENTVGEKLSELYFYANTNASSYFPNGTTFEIYGK